MASGSTLAARWLSSTRFGVGTARFTAAPPLAGVNTMGLPIPTLKLMTLSTGESPTLICVRVFGGGEGGGGGAGAGVGVGGAGVGGGLNGFGLPPQATSTASRQRVAKKG